MNFKADPSNSEFVKNVHQNRLKIGIFSNIPFLSETQNNFHFKPYKIDKNYEGTGSTLLKTPSNLVYILIFI